MARENYRKVKLLKLLELLRKHTDEQHPMTTSAICAAPRVSRELSSGRKA